MPTPEALASRPLIEALEPEKAPSGHGRAQFPHLGACSNTRGLIRRASKRPERHVSGPDLGPRVRSGSFKAVDAEAPGRGNPGRRGRSRRGGLNNYVACVDAALPGSSSGKPLSVALAKAALRLLGGSDVADAVADLTGISRKRVSAIVRAASRELEAQSSHEFRELDGRRGDRIAAEVLLTEAFRRAAATANNQKDVPIAALEGPSALVGLIVDERARAQLADLSEDERGYFLALTHTVADLTCGWYMEDQSARALATAAGVGRGIRDHRQQATALAEILALVHEVRSKVGLTPIEGGPQQVHAPADPGLL